MLNNLGMGLVFTARDLASARIQSLQRRFMSLDESVMGGAARMTSAFHMLGIGLGIFTAGAATLAGTFMLASSAGRFEQGLAGIGAVTHATTRELAMLRETAIEAGIRTQFSPDEAVAGLLTLATAGQTATQATRTLLPVLDLAAGALGQLTVDQAADAVVGTLNAYGLAATEAENITDRLLRITQLTNFLPRDFEAGLAKAAATGSVFGQSLDDVLITMGLLRNRNIDASSAATAYREAVRRVAGEQRAQQAVTGAGVDVFDRTTGRMRSIVDIMHDFATATAGMTEAERNNRIVVAFGARGLLAFNAVQNAAFTTTRNGAEVTMRGAEAIAALRDEMTRTAGTAASFRETLLDTFEGQKTLLRGTLQTYAVVFGEPFAQLFKPIIRAIVNSLNAVLRVFQALPAPAKRAVAALALIFGGLLTLSGGAIAVAAVITLVSLVGETLAVALAGVAAVLVPAIAAVVVLGGVVAGFAVAFRRNVGGIADMASRAFSQVRVGFLGLVQLFEQGGFSGAVRTELGRAGNRELRQFVIDVYRVVYRVRQVWTGFAAGFTGTLDAAAPVFRELGGALRELGRELSSVFGAAVGGAASLPSSQFRSFGQVVGSALATVIRWLARAITAVARIVTGTVSGVRDVASGLGPMISFVRSAFTGLGQAWRELTRTVFSSSSAVGLNVSGWRILGEVIGRVVGGALIVLLVVLWNVVRAVTTIVRVVAAVRDAIVAVSGWVGTALGRVIVFLAQTLPAAATAAGAAMGRFLARTLGLNAGIGLGFARMYSAIAGGAATLVGSVIARFLAMAQAIAQVLAWIRGSVAGALRQVPAGLLPESLAQLARGPLTAEMTVASQPTAVERTETTAARSEAATSAMPAASEAGGRRGLVEQLEAGLAALFSQGERRSQQPLNVNVQVDGETVARATHNADQANAGRAFSPVPVF